LGRGGNDFAAICRKAAEDTEKSLVNRYMLFSASFGDKTMKKPLHAIGQTGMGEIAH